MDLMQVIVEVKVEGLGRKLKDAREASRLSLTVAGGLSGMSGANFSRIENEDTKGVPLETLARACKAVGLNLPEHVGDWVLAIPGFDLQDSTKQAQQNDS